METTLAKVCGAGQASQAWEILEPAKPPPAQFWAQKSQGLAVNLQSPSHSSKKAGSNIQGCVQRSSEGRKMLFPTQWDHK